MRSQISNVAIAILDEPMDMKADATVRKTES